MAEASFTIAIPDSELKGLRAKLEQTLLPDELDGATWDYGAPLGDLKKLLAYWKDGFDWRKAESEFNALPQFTRDIDVDGFGKLNVHYIHQRSKVENAIPLFFSHGWPGSFIEVTKILSLLTSESSNHPSFHVVALSLPGFGFSEAPKKAGFGIHQYAEVGHKLMLALGYNEYVTQGGDWGYSVTKRMASEYGVKHVKAWHTNFPFMTKPTFSEHPIIWLKDFLTPYDSKERENFARSSEWRTTGNGYFLEQSTKPQTIGYLLADSPAGLLAWIYEKLVAWTDNYKWTDDEVLKWVSIYWFSRAGPAASVRIYYELSDQAVSPPPGPANVPFGVSLFPKEVTFARTIWLGALGKIVFHQSHNSGGHFAAYEKPEALVGDLRKMFGLGGPAFGVIPGKEGYNAHSRVH